MIFGFVATSATPAVAAEGSGVTEKEQKRPPRQGLFREEIRFVFRNFEGGFSTVCKHQLASENSPYDWKVQCFDGSEKFATYTAHVALSQYRRESGTRLSIELLYWLTGTNIPSEIGSTTWFHLRDPSFLEEISTSQTVERATAGLYLEILPGDSFRPKKKKKRF